MAKNSSNSSSICLGTHYLSIYGTITWQISRLDSGKCYLPKEIILLLAMALK